MRPTMVDGTACKPNVVPLARRRSKALSTVVANCTGPENVTVRLLTRDRWADPSFTWMDCTFTSVTTLNCPTGAANAKLPELSATWFGSSETTYAPLSAASQAPPGGVSRYVADRGVPFV